MLPRIFPAFPSRTEFDIFASMEPAREVGGDLYDFFFISPSKLFFCIGDVSGKGVPAALFMVITKTLMKANALAGQTPDEILLNLNNSLEPDNTTCMFATVFCAILDTESGELTYSNAGHNPPLLKRAEGRYEFLSLPKSFVVGPLPSEPGRYVSTSTKLKKGDSLFLYSDGITEAMDTQGRLFSDPALEEVLNSLPADCDVTSSVTAVKAAVRKHALGEPQSDDITMLALRFFGKDTDDAPRQPAQ